MTAAALLADLQKRDVVLVADGETLEVDAPCGALTPGLRAALVIHKAELLTLLRESTPRPESPVAAPTEPPGSLPAGTLGFSETASRLLGLDLDAFAEAGACLEVRVPWWPEPLWFVPTEPDAAALVTEGITRGRIWTAGELRDLFAIPGLAADQARTLARAKLAVDGDVVGVRPASPDACRACGGRRWWRSFNGRTMCARCHPPASPDLVAEWLEDSPTC